ncbi:monooxygenase FAD-binding protein [Pilatotrama ljubarskyi]|nr:monooxygenase FAD-binding protein [Pilatotrama ljubarskyi]
MSTTSTTSTQSAQTIAIIGGGPAGLVLLLTLLKRGIPATLYEREPSADSRAHLGGMLDLEWDSGQRALRENGLEEVFKKNSRRDAEETRICGKDGSLVLHRVGADPNDDNLKDARPEIDRRVLRQIMLDALPDASAVKWGHVLTSVRPLGDGKHELTFANGFVTVTDLLVGADGANSRIRPLLSTAKPLYYGATGAEFSIAPDVAALPENRDFNGAVGNGSCYVFQDGKALVFQRNGDGRIRGYVWHRAPLEWSLPRDPAEAKKVLLDILEGWTPWMRRFIELADDDAIYTRPLFYLPVGHRWPHTPGVTLIGDAAHLMGPFAGAGANLAMRDGLDLGLVLDHAATKGLVPEEREAAIAAWEEDMCQRAERFAALTMKNFEIGFGPGAPQTLVDAFNRAIAQH